MYPSCQKGKASPKPRLNLTPEKRLFSPGFEAAADFGFMDSRAHLDRLEIDTLRCAHGSSSLSLSNATCCAHLSAVFRKDGQKQG
jgi:hypothetical protein